MRVNEKKQAEKALILQVGIPTCPPTCVHVEFTKPDPGVGRLRNQTPAAALTDTGSAFLTSRVLLPDSMEAEAGS